MDADPLSVRPATNINNSIKRFGVRLRARLNALIQEVNGTF